MLSMNAASLSFAPTTSFVPTTARAAVSMDAAADVKDLAKKLNPVVGFWDPLNIVESAVEAGTGEATIGWFRHAEIKHGRVAMAAFVGYCVQSNGICFPWALTGGPSPIMHSDILAAGGPSDQWDALPANSKLQILGFVGFLELISETSSVLEAQGQKHYVRGGKPGFFPSLKGVGFPHPVPIDGMWDPFGFTSKMTPEQKEKSLLAEINNGRLAMIGIFGLISASKGLIVPGLDSLGIASYAGEPMAPFTAADNLPLVSQMTSWAAPY